MSIVRNKKRFAVMALIFILAFTVLNTTIAFASDGVFGDDFNVELKSTGVKVTGQGDSTKAWNQVITKYKAFIVGVSAVGAVTMVVLFIIQFVKLGAAAGNPQERSKALTGVLWTGLSAAGLGAVSLIVGIFYNAI